MSSPPYKGSFVLTTAWSIYFGKICLITKACQYCLILIIKACFTVAKNKIDILYYILWFLQTSSFIQGTVDMFLKNLFPISYVLTCLYLRVTYVHFFMLQMSIGANLYSEFVWKLLFRTGEISKLE